MDHPNILKIYEFYEDASNIYIVTEVSTQLAQRRRSDHHTHRSPHA